jgi:ubiquinone/menaquinone biosynthesis C-methylase UbiE
MSSMNGLNKRFFSRLKPWLRRAVPPRQPKAFELPQTLPIPIIRATNSGATPVSDYWNDHTVRSMPFQSAAESIKYNHWIDEQYPLYHTLMKLYDYYDDQVVVEYGCGPANDLVGFLAYSKARQVIGIDVSEKALRLASHRLGLHDFDKERIKLILISDTASPEIPLEDNSVDYIHSQGVLHHTNNTASILRQFYRILKPGSTARIMVYNYDSIFVHLYIAYERMIVQNAFPGANLEEAFTHSTDGEDCPISRYYHSPDFVALCSQAGFETQYLGGYLSLFEIDKYKLLAVAALDDPRLAQKHKHFLYNLTWDDQKLPLFEGKHAGIGGVYELRKA